MRYCVVLLIFFLSTSCNVDLGLLFSNPDFLPQEIAGFQSENMTSGDGTGNDSCVTVDMGGYYKINPDNSVNRNENVAAAICQSSMAQRKWQGRVDDLSASSKQISSLVLAEGVQGKYYAPDKTHVFILWRDGDFISHVSAFSESGDAHNLAVTVASVMIPYLKHIRETQDPFKEMRNK
jgi:hypothetical protein